MKHIIKIIVCLFIGSGILGCNKDVRHIYHEYNMEVLLRKCKIENKYLLVILGTQDCEFCQLFYTMLENTISKNIEIEDKYLITRVNIVEEPALAQILSITSSPTIFVVDKNLSVKYIHSGLLAETQFAQVLLEIQNGEEVYTLQQNTLYSVGQELYQLYSHVLQAYFLTNRLRVDSSDRQEAVKLLEKSILIEPYSMNRYLLMENYMAMGRKNVADSLRKCLVAPLGFSDENRVIDIIEKASDMELPEDKRAVFYTENNILDLGDIERGKTTEIILHFTNKGDSPLIINKVDGSCGCIESEWERRPLLKNEKGEIKIKYYTENQGYLSKRVMIFSNTARSPSIIALKGVIK